MEFCFEQTPVSQQEIINVITFWKKELPDSLIKVIKTHNGASVCGENIVIDSLISFSRFDEFNIFTAISILKENGILSLFPWGTDGGGNYFCLDYTYCESCPFVTLLDHETLEQEFLAKTFDEFWGMIG